jgi:hypothetical protein
MMTPSETMRPALGGVEPVPPMNPVSVAMSVLPTVVPLSSPAQRSHLPVAWTTFVDGAKSLVLRLGFVSSSPTSAPFSSQKRSAALGAARNP